MYHSKSILDYMAEMEMNRYPRTDERDMFRSPSTSISSFNQTSLAHSSSSTETSPDSFPDLTPHQFSQEFRPEESRKPDFYQRNHWRQEQCDNQLRRDHFDSLNFRPENAFKSQRSEAFESQMRPFENMHPENPYGSRIHSDLNNLMLTEHMCETPLIARRQRPIIGRKIMATPEPLKTINEFLMWQPNLPNTSPKSLEQKYPLNTYELFPSENRGFEFPSPIKTSTSPQLGTSPKVALSPQVPMSPRVPISPITSTPSLTPPPKSPFSPRMPTPFKEPLIGPNMSFTTNYGSPKMCTFCRKNGETPVVYMTHAVKERVGNKHVVSCPILRSHVCPICGASGDNAHTITYCPVLRSDNNGRPLQSTTITLKNTRVKSNGRRRY